MASDSSRRDFGWEEHFSETSITATNGQWKGVFDDNGGGYVFPLFQGFQLALNTGKTGVRFPLDSSKYTGISFLLKTSVAKATVINWTHQVNWPDGTYAAYLDDLIYYTNTQQRTHDLNNQWRCKFVDLSANAGWTVEDVLGLRLDPSLNSPAGTEVIYDWVRVYDPASTGTIQLKWKTSGLSWLNSYQNGKVHIYIVSVGTGPNGAFLARVDNTGSCNIPGAMLPPGNYQFYLQLQSNKDSDNVLSTSGLSGTIVINGKPRVTLQKPSYTSGNDYATTSLLNKLS